MGMWIGDFSSDGKHQTPLLTFLVASSFSLSSEHISCLLSLARSHCSDHQGRFSLLSSSCPSSLFSFSISPQRFFTFLSIYYLYDCDVSFLLVHIHFVYRTTTALSQLSMLCLCPVNLLWIDQRQRDTDTHPTDSIPIVRMYIRTRGEEQERASLSLSLCIRARLFCFFLHFSRFVSSSFGWGALVEKWREEREKKREVYLDVDLSIAVYLFLENEELV